MVFDEATSSLDSKSEKSILTAMKNIAAGMTTLVIAHRLSTIVDADRIYVLDQGKIVEYGHHTQLLQKPGLYSQLWSFQQREQKDREIETVSTLNDVFKGVTT